MGKGLKSLFSRKKEQTKTGDQAKKDSKKSRDKDKAVQAPPSSGRARRNAMTPGQAEQSLADFKQYQETDQKAREANRQMMQQERADQERRKKEASKASFYNRLMMMKEASQNSVDNLAREKQEEKEREEARQKEASKAAFYNRLMMMKEDSQRSVDNAAKAREEREQEERRQEERKNRIAGYRRLVEKIDQEYYEVKAELDSSSPLSQDISHTEEAQVEIQHISERYDIIRAMQDTILVNYASLMNEKEVDMAADGTRMSKNMVYVSDKLNRAKRKAAKSVPARRRLAKHAGQKEVHQMMRVIHRATEDNGDYSMIPQNENQQPQQQSQSQQPQSQQPQSQQQGEKSLKERFTAWVSKWNSKILNAVDLINGIMSSSGDLTDNGGVQQAGGGIGAVLALIGTIKNVIQSVKNFSKWKSERNQEDGKSSYSRGREAISAFNQVVDILKDLLDIGNGTIGAIGGMDPVSNILSIVSGGLTLLQQTVNLSDSQGALSGIEKRKEKIRAKMREKQVKYKDDSELAYWFTLDSKARSDTVKKKREQLRAQLAKSGGTLFAGRNGGAGISAQRVELATASQGNNFRNTETATVNGENRQVGYTGYTRLSQALAERKGILKVRTDKDSTQYKDEKKKVRMMEALELLNEYYAEDEARDRQRKQRRGGWIEIAKAATSIVANILKFFKGTGADVAGYVIDMLGGIADKVQYAVQKVYAGWSEKSGHNNDKKLRRNEIAESFFESIKDLTTYTEYHWDDTEGFSLDSMKDFRLMSASDRVSEFAGMIHGTKVNIEPIMQQTSRGKIIQMMSQAYAQDQSVD